jgi:small subunit ribosomal protein S9
MEINLELEKKAEEVVSKTEEQKPVKGNVDKLGRIYATGKRKRSISRVWLKKGTGKIKVNNKKFEDYFKSEIAANMIVNIPFEIIDAIKKFDITCTIKGGGKSGQIDALKAGISKALSALNPEAYKSLLRKAGLLTRDSRVVERKKYGRKKARKSFQFSKR